MIFTVCGKTYFELVPKPGVFFDDDFARPSAALHGA